MAHAAIHYVLQYLRRLPLIGQADLDDTQLLRRFVEDADEAAFTLLVRRHGPMVWGVCQRLLTCSQDAEDAFQATFLVLVRRARRLRSGLLGPWLHEVAKRTALKLRATTARRQQRECAAVTEFSAEDPFLEKAWNELRPVLDEEVGRLPEKYRTPFVLCYLEGLTNEAAAEKLGCPKGTVLSRLSRGRELLRRRLTRRGVGLSAGVLTAALSENSASSAVPPLVIDTTIRSCLGVAAGGTATVLSAQVAALAEGVLHNMFLTQLKMTAMLALTIGVLGSGVGLLAHDSASRSEPVPAAEVPNPPKADPVLAENPEAQEKRPAGDTKKPSLVNIDQLAQQWSGLLKQPVGEIRFDDPKQTLGETLALLTDRYDFVFEVDEKAFTEEGLSDVMQFALFAQRPLPGLKNVTLSTALRLILDRLPVHAVFVIRKDTIEITTVRAYRAELGFDPDRPLLPLVWENIENMPLAEALRLLAKDSGMNVVLDPHALDDSRAKTGVSARFENVPVDTAVRVLASMVDLEMVRLDNVLYVTTAARASQLEKKPNTDAAPPLRSPRQMGGPAPGGA
jgi:RNA polymerase sigma factor (sigma-70 family)